MESECQRRDLMRLGHTPAIYVEHWAIFISSMIGELTVLVLTLVRLLVGWSFIMLHGIVAW